MLVEKVKRISVRQLLTNKACFIDQLNNVGWIGVLRLHPQDVVNILAIDIPFTNAQLAIQHRRNFLYVIFRMNAGSKYQYITYHRVHKVTVNLKVSTP